MKIKYITNKFKMVIILASILALALVLTPIRANAATATATLVPSAQSVKEGGEFTVQFKLSNIDAAQGGITTVTGTLGYDENAFEVIQDTSIEGKNDWKVTYDSFSKKITATHQQIIKNDGDIFQISFKAKSKGTGSSSAAPSVTPAPTPGGNQGAKIELKEISASNGIENFQINDISTSVVIGNGGVVSQPAPTPTPSQTSTPTPSQEPTPAPAPVEPKPIPGAGVEDAPVILLIAMGSTAVISGILLRLKRA